MAKKPVKFPMMQGVRDENMTNNHTVGMIWLFNPLLHNNAF